MGTLSSKERQALEDIFSSISSRNRNDNIIQHTVVPFMKLLKVAKIGAKKSKFHKFILIFSKKKKSLSK